jgi:hypothetical protein
VEDEDSQQGATQEETRMETTAKTETHDARSGKPKSAKDAKQKRVDDGKQKSGVNGKPNRGPGSNLKRAPKLNLPKKLRQVFERHDKEETNWRPLRGWDRNWKRGYDSEQPTSLLTLRQELRMPLPVTQATARSFSSPPSDHQKS